MLRQKENKEHLAKAPDGPSLVSCKSMYRLAEKVSPMEAIIIALTDAFTVQYDAVELTHLSLEWFIAHLSPTVVLSELFTPYASLYPKIKEILLQYLFTHWSDMQPMVLSKLRGFSNEERLKHYWLTEAIIEKSKI